MSALCREFHCLPSQVLAEDAQVLQLLNLVGQEEVDPYGQ